VSTAATVSCSFEEPLGKAQQRRYSLLEFVAASGLQSLVVGASKNPNAKITVLLVSPASGQPVLALKVPTTDAAARAVEAEARVLVALEELPPGVMETIPRIVDTVEFDGRPGIVMTAVEGTPMTTSYQRWRHTARSARVAAHFAAVGSWLGAAQRATAGELAPLDMDGEALSRLSSRFSEDPLVDDAVDQLGEIYARLRRNTVPRTAVHGDLWFGNVLLSGGRVSGVVDWEAGATSGEPVRDLVRFALMYALFLDRRTRPGRRVTGHPGLRAGDWGAGVEYAFDGTGWFPELFRQFLREGLDRLGASPTSWRDAALAGIAEVAAFADHDEFARLHLQLFRRLAVPRPQRRPTKPVRRLSRRGGFTR
jgi:aminoglycoside phosphotransferase (APT) family kinase protein